MTTIYGTDKYVDLVPAGKRLFISPGIFGNVEITNKMAKIERLQIDEQINMPSAIFNGVIGTAVAGIMGTIIGVALASNDPVVAYHIVFKPGEFELEEIYCVTSDKYLDYWLRKRMEVV